MNPMSSDDGTGTILKLALFMETEHASRRLSFRLTCTLAHVGWNVGEAIEKVLFHEKPVVENDRIVGPPRSKWVRRSSW
jgi:hypothetical protein